MFSLFYSPDPRAPDAYGRHSLLKQPVLQENNQPEAESAGEIRLDLQANP